MSFYKTLFMVVGAIAPVSAFAGGVERVADVPWGSGPGEAGMMVAPDGRQGPQDFDLDGDGAIWLLDTVNRRAFRTDNPDRFTAVQEGAVLMYVEGGRVSTIGAGGTVELAGPSGGAAPSSAAVPYPTSFSAEGGVARMGSGGIGVPAGAFTAGTAVEEPGRAVAVLEGGGEKTVYVLEFPGLLAAMPVGLREDGLLAAELQAGPDGPDGRIVRRAALASTGGGIVASIEIPAMKYAAARRDVRLGRSGHVYVMLSSPSGVEFWKWDGSPGAAFPSDYFDLEFRPGDGLCFEGTAGPILPAAPQPVTRSAALATAALYEGHSWTASAANIGTTTCTDWCSKTKDIVPPAWVKVGANTRFPYCWGGYSSIAGLDQGLLDGKKAGDVQTTYAGGGAACGSSCAVGVDCSGFVSRCWNAGAHYGTSQMDQIASAISKSALKPADALNNAGSHIRLFVAKRGDGNWDMVESYAGSGYWGVGYTVRSPADNADYTAVRYDLIQEDPPADGGIADAGASDAGITDTGALDGGVADSGAVDAGSDAGDPSDAGVDGSFGDAQDGSFDGAQDASNLTDRSDPSDQSDPSDAYTTADSGVPGPEPADGPGGCSCSALGL